MHLFLEGPGPWPGIRSIALRVCGDGPAVGRGGCAGGGANSGRGHLYKYRLLRRAHACYVELNRATFEIQTHTKSKSKKQLNAHMSPNNYKRKPTNKNTKRISPKKQTLRKLSSVFFPQNHTYEYNLLYARPRVRTLVGVRHR